jgi:integrase
LLRAIEGYSGQPTTRLALQLSALLFVRPGELRLARWKEIDFDKAIWVVPAATMRMNRPIACRWRARRSWSCASCIA